jgi:hypothetical protein
VALKIKTYEEQAKLSVILAVIGSLFALAALGGVLRNFDPSTGWVRFGTKSMFMPALGICLLLAVAFTAIGFSVGLHSAGQRRNKRSRLSWTGFFLNAAVLMFALCVGVFFVITRHGIAPIE